MLSNKLLEKSTLDTIWLIEIDMAIVNYKHARIDIWVTCYWPTLFVSRFNMSFHYSFQIFNKYFVFHMLHIQISYEEPEKYWRTCKYQFMRIYSSKAHFHSSNSVFIRKNSLSKEIRKPIQFKKLKTRFRCELSDQKFSTLL
jgi:hypothetical protein